MSGRPHGRRGFAPCADARRPVAPSGLAEEASLHMRVATKAADARRMSAAWSDVALAMGDVDSWRGMNVQYLQRRVREGGARGKAHHRKIKENSTAVRA